MTDTDTNRAALEHEAVTAYHAAIRAATLMEAQAKALSAADDFEEGDAAWTVCHMIADAIAALAGPGD